MVAAAVVRDHGPMSLNGAAYIVVFTTSDVTTRDYFHTSVAGQTKAAAAIWGAFP